MILAQRACRARALDAAGRGDFEAAYENAATVARPGTLDYAPQGLRVLFDLVEAAMRTGRRDAALAHVQAMLGTDIASLSPRLAMLVAGATALLDDGTNDAFERALTVPDATRWPFDLARVHLTYGERLRRDRATSDARRHLSAAREIFNQLGAAPWVARASSELRATGQPAAHDQRPDQVTLTPQQREIATLAAAGPNEQADRRAAVPVAPHGRHTPVSDLPETRRHFEGGTTRRIVQQRRSRGDGPVALTRRPALSATPLAAASPSSCVLASVLLGRHMAWWGSS